jgi:hypothetical protein
MFMIVVYEQHFVILDKHYYFNKISILYCFSKITIQIFDRNERYSLNDIIFTYFLNINFNLNQILISSILVTIKCKLFSFVAIL